MFLLCKGSIEKNTTSFNPSFSFHKKPFQGINRGKSLTSLVVWLQAGRRWPRSRVAPDEPAPHISVQLVHINSSTCPRGPFQQIQGFVCRPQRLPHPHSTRIPHCISVCGQLCADGFQAPLLSIGRPKIATRTTSSF
jgi:hypothetical protein